MKRTHDDAQEEPEAKRVRVDQTALPDPFPFLDLLPEMQGEVVARIPEHELGDRAALARTCKQMHALVHVQELPEHWHRAWEDAKKAGHSGGEPGLVVCFRHRLLVPLGVHHTHGPPRACWLCSMQTAFRFLLFELRLHTWPGVFRNAWLRVGWICPQFGHALSLGWWEDRPVLRDCIITWSLGERVLSLKVDTRRYCLDYTCGAAPTAGLFGGDFVRAWKEFIARSRPRNPFAHCGDRYEFDGDHSWVAV